MNIFKNLPLFPEQASTMAAEVDALYFAALFIAAFFSLLIAVLLLTFAVKYKRRSDDDYGIPEKTSTPLEITWSVIPLLITLVLFAWGVKVFVDLRQPPSDAVEYFAVGKQWMWKFQHPEGNREINALHIPVGQPIKMTMTSEDVIHSFFVPEFRTKMDVLPGRYSTVWFEATKVGQYHLFCAEYCGAEHSRMIGSVYAMEPADYEAWLAGREPGQTVAASGEELFQSLACHTCHRGNDTGRGPILAELDGGEVILKGGRKLVRDDAYLRESILNPGAKIVDGFDPLMPSYQGQVSEEQLLSLIRYLKQLDQRGVPADPQTAAIEAPAAGS
jgi:cytochrome c oxidase subunit 2